jgi:cytochrome c-type biogenesis protein CcsB
MTGGEMSLSYLGAMLATLISSILFGVYLARQKERLFRIAHLILWVGFLLWTLDFVQGFRRLGILPVYDLGSSLFFFGWCGVLIYLLCQWRFKLTVLGAFVTPIALFLGLVSGGVGGQVAYPSPHLKGFWFHLHVIAMFLGMALFFLSSVVSGLYLWVDRSLKQKRLGSIDFRLPSLGVLDQIGHYALSWGFPLYSVGMITGSLYSQATFGRYWQWDPKEVWALVTWILYAILLHERLALGWRGKKAALLTMVCFTVLLFTFLAISHLDGGYHTFKNLSGAR